VAALTRYPVVREVVQVVMVVLVVHPQLLPQGLGSKVVTLFIVEVQEEVVRLRRVQILLVIMVLTAVRVYQFLLAVPRLYTVQGVVVGVVVVVTD
jgi:hypothetical protein